MDRLAAPSFHDASGLAGRALPELFRCGPEVTEVVRPNCRRRFALDSHSSPPIETCPFGTREKLSCRCWGRRAFGRHRESAGCLSTGGRTVSRAVRRSRGPSDREDMKHTEKIAPVAAALSALATLTCCLPIAFVAGTASASLAMVAGSYRWSFLGASVVLLAVGAVQLVRARRACQPRGPPRSGSSVCPPPSCWSWCSSHR